MSEMVKKYHVALFLDSSATETPNWVQMKKSTAFDLTFNPETQDFDYISDESPTTELMKYKLSLNQALTMYKGEADYSLIYDKLYNLSVGSDAKSKVLIVFYKEPLDTTAETHAVFKAWQSDCVLSINDMNTVDSTITFDILFGGTVKKGYATISSGTPTFTEGSYTPPTPPQGE